MFEEEEEEEEEVRRNRRDVIQTLKVHWTARSTVDDIVHELDRNDD